MSCERCAPLAESNVDRLAVATMNTWRNLQSTHARPRVTTNTLPFRRYEQYAVQLGLSQIGDTATGSIRAASTLGCFGRDATVCAPSASPSVQCSAANGSVGAPWRCSADTGDYLARTVDCGRTPRTVHGLTSIDASLDPHCIAVPHPALLHIHNARQSNRVNHRRISASSARSTITLKLQVRRPRDTQPEAASGTSAEGERSSKHEPQVVEAA